MGNYLELLPGPDAQVFLDDRVDMYPTRWSTTTSRCMRGQPGWPSVLDRWDIDVVLWQRASAAGPARWPMTPRWRLAYADEDWVVYVRR